MRERCWRTFSASCKMDSNEAGVTHAMPLFVIGFCYSSPLACGRADALSTYNGYRSTTHVRMIASSGKTVVNNQMR